MSSSRNGQNFVEKSFFFPELFQKNLRRVILTPHLRFLRVNTKKPVIRSIYHFHVYYHTRGILKVLEILLPCKNTLNQYNNPYNHEKFIKIEVSMELVII